MNASKEKSQVSAPGRVAGGGNATIAGSEERVIGVSRRIWTTLAFLVVLCAGAAFTFFRSQGALDSTRAALDKARAELKETKIALSHAIEAKEQAVADKDQLVKELAAQGDKLAEFSRGEEKAKSQAAQASSGVEAAQRNLAALKKKLANAEQTITALTAELEVTRAALEQARADVELWRQRAEPYGQPTPRPATPGNN